MHKHIPHYIKTQNWDEIEDFYADLIENYSFTLEPMRDLVRHIKATGLAERLFAFTAHSHLIISIYPELDRESEAFHVEFDQGSRNWHFQYHPNPFTPREFDKIYPEELGIEKFDLFIRLMRW